VQGGLVQPGPQYAAGRTSWPVRLGANRPSLTTAAFPFPASQLRQIVHASAGRRSWRGPIPGVPATWSWHCWSPARLGGKRPARPLAPLAAKWRIGPARPRRAPLANLVGDDCRFLRRTSACYRPDLESAWLQGRLTHGDRGGALPTPAGLAAPALSAASMNPPQGEANLRLRVIEAIERLGARHRPAPNGYLSAPSRPVRPQLAAPASGA